MIYVHTRLFPMGILLFNKFINDKVLYQDDDYIVVFEGIVFNESTISNTKWIKKLISLFKKERLFFRNIEGNFSGAIFDKQKKRWIKMLTTFEKEWK